MVIKENNIGDWKDTFDFKNHYPNKSICVKKIEYVEPKQKIIKNAIYGQIGEFRNVIDRKIRK